MTTATDTTTLPGSIRGRFPIFEHRAYLNSCSQGALSDAVRDAYGDYLRGLEFEGSLWDHWVERQELVRGDLARLLGATPSEIAVTTSVSAGVSALASAIDFTGTRNTVVTTELEFPTIGQIWHAQESRGASVVHVRADDDYTIPIERFAEAIDEHTAIVSVTLVCYRNGALSDVKPIIDLAHSRGALVLIDGYQGIGAVPMDVAALGADFVTGGCLKYLLASPGAGFLYARADTTAALRPTATGWFCATDIYAMEIHSYDPAADARRFESGTPSVPSLYAAHAGIELLLGVGVEATRRHVTGLWDQLAAGVEEIGGRVVTPSRHHGPMLAVATTDEVACVAALDADDVVTSCRDGNVRISLHCYNDASDIEAALISLRKHRDLLA